MRLLFLCLLLQVVTFGFASGEERVLELHDGDRVVLLGNTLLERAQRYGYLETEFVRFHPDREIIFRNLAWSGDTVYGDSWTYSKSHADHTMRSDRLYEVIERQRPTVIIVGFGAVEAFDGDKALGRWRGELGKMLDRLATSNAKLALLTSPPQQPNRSRSASKYNKQLKKYNAVLAEVASERKLPLLDVAKSIADYYGRHPDAPLTENGLHFNAKGYRLFARMLVESMGCHEPDWEVTVDARRPAVDSSSATVGQVERDEDRISFSLTDPILPQPFTGSDDPRSVNRRLKVTGLREGRYTLYADGVEMLTASAEDLARGVQLVGGPEFDQADLLRQAIVEKNRLFFARWRPENETYLSGFRRREQGRNVVELPLFDPLIRKQEEEITRLKHARETFYHLIPGAPASSIGPEVVPEPDPAAELDTFRVADGFEVSLFASEPMVTNPISMNWDSQGRLWVATSPIYPHLKPGQKADDEIIVLEDTDGDGRADKRTVFADGLLVPTGVLPGDGGAYLANSTELVHMSDTDGDGRADRTRVLLSGFGTEDTHQILHTFRWAPGGRLFFNQSVLINSHIETSHGVRRLAAAGIWEYDVADDALAVYARGMVNPWGLEFDRWGQSFATDGAYGEGINYVWPGAAFYWARGVPRILKGLNPGQPKECGLVILTGRHVPPTWRDRLLTADFRAHRIVSFSLRENQSGYFSEQREDLIQSNHVAFRPVDLKMGPDGAIYICDWYNSIINHGEVDFRDPRRDHQHGRIWRVTAKGRATLPNPRLDQADVSELVKALESPEQWTRDIARRELKHRNRDAAIDELKRWVSRMNPSDDSFHQHRVEALWSFETIDAVPPDYLRSLLRSNDHRVRAASVRVLSHLAGDYRDALKLLEETIVDEHPRVRLESVNALRSIQTLAAFDVALRALDHPMDEQIDYALWVTVRELEPIWLPPFEDGLLTFGGNVGRVAFVLSASEKQSVLEPLIERFRADTLTTEVRAKVAELIAVTGNAEQLRVLFDEALELEGSAHRTALLSELLNAARDRGLKPSGDLDGVLGLMSEEPVVVSLVGLWRLRSASRRLRSIITDRNEHEATRLRAMNALADIGRPKDAETLATVVNSDGSQRLRAAALSAMTGLDLPRAASVAPHVLMAVRSTEAETVFQGFLSKTGGPAALAAGLAGHSLPEEVASLGMSLASPLGDRADMLVESLISAGGTRPSRAELDPQRWASLISAVSSEGDPARGEEVYRRNELSCQKCHSIGGAGGKVGPDLMSIGASAPLDYIAESLVHPSRKIKEGYETTVVILESGQIVTGLLIGEVGEHLLMRTSENIVRRVLKDQVDEQLTQAASLMPTGLTDPLRRDEFIDLVAFLTALGKKGEFRVPTNETVRVWESIDPTALSTDEPVASEVIDSKRWLKLYSRAGGALPLTETGVVPMAGRPRHVVRFRLDVYQPGSVQLRVHSELPFQIWVDGASVSHDGSKVTIHPDVGEHWVTLAIDRIGDPQQVRVERVVLPESSAQAAFSLE